MKNGYANEFDFVEALNDKFVYQLDDRYVKLLKKIFGNYFDEKSYVICWKSFKTDKTDIIIRVGPKKKNISIKNGKNNSVHLEHINYFMKFLRENGATDEIIKIYENYHYALDENGNKLNAKDYQEMNKEKISIFNNFANEERVLAKAIDRFLFSGINDFNHKVDAIIYGTVDNFGCITREEIMNYLMSRNDKFDSIHFSLLVLQPWTRNLSNNLKYEYRRDYVQVKLYMLENIIEEVK